MCIQWDGMFSHITSVDCETNKLAAQKWVPMSTMCSSGLEYVIIESTCTQFLNSSPWVPTVSLNLLRAVEFIWIIEQYWSVTSIVFLTSATINPLDVRFRKLFVARTEGCVNYDGWFEALFRCIVELTCSFGTNCRYGRMFSTLSFASFPQTVFIPVL